MEPSDWPSASNDEGQTAINHQGIQGSMLAINGTIPIRPCHDRIAELKPPLCGCHFHGLRGYASGVIWFVSDPYRCTIRTDAAPNIAATIPVTAVNAHAAEIPNEPRR